MLKQKRRYVRQTYALLTVERVGIDPDQLSPEQAGMVVHRDTGRAPPVLSPCTSGNKMFRGHYRDYFREWGLMDTNRRYDE